MSNITAELIKRESKQYDCEVVVRLKLEKKGNMIHHSVRITSIVSSRGPYDLVPSSLV